MFSCKAKLYHFTGKEWKERGIGTFKLNVTEDENESRKTARLIMRTVGVFRVVLNTPVFQGMKIGDNAGKEPTGKMINLAGVENGKPVPLMLKVSLISLSSGVTTKRLRWHGRSEQLKSRKNYIVRSRKCNNSYKI